MSLPSTPIAGSADTVVTEGPTGSKERRSSSIDLHEAPVDVEQYGLEKLNASLTELRGE